MARSSITGSHEFGKHGFGIAAVKWQRLFDSARIGEGGERLIRSRIDCIGSRQRLDMERIRRIGIPGPGAGPEEALRPSTDRSQRAPAWRREHVAILPIGALSHGDAEPIAERWRHRVVHRNVPMADTSEAAESTRGSRPAAIRRSMPRMQASAAATYCAAENSSVTFIATPLKIDSSIAGTPSGVPGILTKKLGR